jgi:hypothetical protein
MQKKTALSFEEMLMWLITEVIYGQAHFKITRGLSHADQAVLDAAPTFFYMTLVAHATEAQLAATRIFDRSSAVSIHKLLPAALGVAGTFKHGTAPEIRSFVAEAKACVTRLEPMVTALRTRRNETIAHADLRPFVDPAGYVKAGRIGYRELERLFLQIGSILNKFATLYRGKSVDLEMKGWRDYEQALDLVAHAKGEQVKRYEAGRKGP